MAGLRVFVSSTCFDLAAQRSQVRGLLTRMGYEPIMSDHSDVLFDPRLHTHTSCIKEVVNADMMILLIGSRFGGGAVPQSLSEVDFETISKSTSRADLIKETDKLSITQVEVLKAIEIEVPLFAFVESKVYSDHHLYQRNKHQKFAEEISYPSVEKQSSAKYIFEFINLITHRFSNNSMIPYSSFADIEDHLVKQWSMMFQRYLREDRDRTFEARRADAILEQIQDVKAAVLQTMANGAGKDIARAVIRYRRLIDFLLAMQAIGPDVGLVNFTGSFDELLTEYGVLEILYTFASSGSITRTIMQRESDHLIARVPDRRFNQFYAEWKSFSQLSVDTKGAVLSGVAESDHSNFPLVRKGSEVLDDEFVSDEMAEAIEVPDVTDDQVSGSWTVDRIKTLIEMWNAGATASQIAESLGGVSRNAVIGKAHRLGLQARPSPVISDS